MDPLSDVLSLLRPRSYASGGLSAGGDWSIQFPAHDGIKCYAIEQGQCWLAVDGVADPLRLSKGDCFLLARGKPFRLASDITLPSTNAESIYAGPRQGGPVEVNGGGGCFLVGGYVDFTFDPVDPLLKLLPLVVHIPKEADKAVMRWTLDRMTQELSDPQPGGFLIAKQLVYLMLLQALRIHLSQRQKSEVGWLSALADKQLNASISAIHAEPSRRWTLPDLAARCGMSRAAFARKFKEKVGESPMEYLTRWRMVLAGHRLIQSNDSISDIAGSLAYESESAFSTAFKRVMGCSPRQYCRTHSSYSVMPE